MHSARTRRSYAPQVISVLHRLSAQLGRLDERVGVGRPRASAWSPEIGVLWPADEWFAWQYRVLLRSSALIAVGLVVGLVRQLGPIGLPVALAVGAAGLLGVLVVRRLRQPPQRPVLRWENYPEVSPDTPVEPPPGRSTEGVLLLALGVCGGVALALGDSFVSYVAAGPPLILASAGPRRQAAQRAWSQRTGQRVLVTARWRGRTYFRQQLAPTSDD